MTARRCTFRRDGIVCGRTEEDKTTHVAPDERMRRGAHVRRYEPRPPARPDRQHSPEYRRGCQAGYHAGSRVSPAAGSTEPEPSGVDPQELADATRRFRERFDR
jgi:hypothetical protein